MITLRPHQIAAADAVEAAYAAGCQRPLVDACVGSGKSLIMAEIARRAYQRGERTIICAHTRELVEQNANACRSLGLACSINAAALNERTWRAPVISVAIQSVYGFAGRFGPVQNLYQDECHLTPPSDDGMYREFRRGFPQARNPGFTGTIFRLQGGSLVDGENPQFERVVFSYGIVDGIRDGYLVPAFSAAAEDQMNPILLRKSKGEYDTASQDAQMLRLMDSHITQMIHHGADRRAWLIFEASRKAAQAMTERLNQWGVSAGCVLGNTAAGERARLIADFKAGRLRAIVNVAALTTGFDAPNVDLLVMRRRTMSLGLYVQMTGRALRTIGGNIDSSIAAGKANCLVLDFAGNIDQHGPLDFIRPKESKVKLIKCGSCNALNSSGARQCWNCGSPLMKLCPACLVEIQKGTLDCPHCGYDMRTGEGEEQSHKLWEMPSGSALIAAFKPLGARGDWIPIRKAFDRDGTAILVDINGDQWVLPAELATHAVDSRWVRGSGGRVDSLLKPNGLSRSSALQVSLDGSVLPVPMPN